MAISLADSVPRILLRDLCAFLLSLSPSRICVSESTRPALRSALEAMVLDPEAGVDVENMLVEMGVEGDEQKSSESTRRWEFWTVFSHDRAASFIRRAPSPATDKGPDRRHYMPSAQE